MIAEDETAHLAAGRPARPWLLADIGGTNARFGWLAPGSGALAHVVSLRASDHTGPAAAGRAYLDELSRQLGRDYSPPRAGAFACISVFLHDSTFRYLGPVLYCV